MISFRGRAASVRTSAGFRIRDRTALSFASGSVPLASGRDSITARPVRADHGDGTPWDSTTALDLRRLDWEDFMASGTNRRGNNHEHARTTSAGGSAGGAGGPAAHDPGAVRTRGPGPRAGRGAQLLVPVAVPQRADRAAVARGGRAVPPGQAGPPAAAPAVGADLQSASGAPEEQPPGPAAPPQRPAARHARLHRARGGAGRRVRRRGQPSRGLRRRYGGRRQDLPRRARGAPARRRLPRRAALCGSARLHRGPPSARSRLRAADAAGRAGRPLRAGPAAGCGATGRLLAVGAGGAPGRGGPRQRRRRRPGPPAAARRRCLRRPGHQPQPAAGPGRGAAGLARRTEPRGERTAAGPGERRAGRLRRQAGR